MLLYDDRDHDLSYAHTNATTRYNKTCVGVGVGSGVGSSVGGGGDGLSGQYTSTKINEAVKYILVD